MSAGAVIGIVVGVIVFVVIVMMMIRCARMARGGGTYYTVGTPSYYAPLPTAPVVVAPGWGWGYGHHHSGGWSHHHHHGGGGSVPMQRSIPMGH